MPTNSPILKLPASTFRFLTLPPNKIAIVDEDRFEALSKFAWRAVKKRFNWYAQATIQTKGGPVEISMHRFIARTPLGMVCHHINRNSLDNRRSNLLNMTKFDHRRLHADNNLRKKIDPTPTIQ